MSIYTRHTKLCDVILSHPSVIPIVNRFGIFLGVGDKTIDSICAEHTLDLTLFLAILNTYLDPGYVMEESHGEINLKELVGYLEKTDLYYRDLLLPNIERHFSLLISRKVNKADNRNLQLLKGFFMEVKEEMLRTIERDIAQWFPYLIECSEGMSSASPCVTFPFDNHILEEKVEDLLHFFVIHLKGEYDSNLCMAVVSSLSTLGQDIRKNNRLRDHLLKPLCQKYLS